METAVKSHSNCQMVSAIPVRSFDAGGDEHAALGTQETPVLAIHKCMYYMLFEWVHLVYKIVQNPQSLPVPIEHISVVTLSGTDFDV